jgi:putative endonuclease
VAENSWFVYIVRCSDKTLYTGITSDLQRRLREHNSKIGGAKYTRSRKPVELVYSELGTSRSAVCKREYQIKKMSAKNKIKLITGAHND